ncbi:hypothetical protein C8R44DRAFT_724920 [Mycena epipterygia]|nr:hypothetical protein C8R44DRAFT_724920 [Mycena epipterygia]
MVFLFSTVAVLANFKKTALDLADSSRLEVTPSDFTRQSRVEPSQTSNQVDLASRDSTFRVAATLLGNAWRIYVQWYSAKCKEEVGEGTQEQREIAGRGESEEEFLMDGMNVEEEVQMWRGGRGGRGGEEGEAELEVPELREVRIKPEPFEFGETHFFGRKPTKMEEQSKVTELRERLGSAWSDSSHPYFAGFSFFWDCQQRNMRE